jgi:PAS domain S-box-containing protein
MRYSRPARPNSPAISRPKRSRALWSRPGNAWRAACPGCLSLAVVTLAQAASSAPLPSTSSSPWVPHLTELFWALVILGGFVLLGIVWAASVRRDTRRRAASIQQREAVIEAYYRDLFENAHDVVLSLDADARVLSLNQAGEALLGYSRDEARGRSISEWITPEHRPAFQDLLERCGKRSEAVHGEFEFIARDDHTVALRLNLRAQRLPGRAPHFQGVAWDVTERRRAEEALRESEQRLRHSLEERVRIGRDLHDGIIQSIYAIGLNLGECQRLLDGNPAQAREDLARSISDLNRVIREVRAFIQGLEPEALKGREFCTALEMLADTVRRTGDLQVVLVVDPLAANCLNASHAADLLQITREAMSNSLKHGRASTIRVGLQKLETTVHLEIRDDGTGFDPLPSQSAGLGLRNMEARARGLGARFQIESGHGQGTRIQVDLPLIAPRESD